MTVLRLNELIHAGTFNHIDDPVEWQRSLRIDRPLPGRIHLVDLIDFRKIDL